MLANETDYRSALFEAVEGANPSPSKLSSLIFRGARLAEGVHVTSHEQQKVLLNCISTFHKGFARRFFSGLKAVLERIVEEEIFVPESAFHESDYDTSAEDDSRSSEALEFLKAASLAVQAHLKGLVERRTGNDATTKTYQVIDEVFACAEALHNTLFSLEVCGVGGLTTQTMIAKLCEFWWNHHFVDRECMVVQLLPLLLAKSLDEAARKQDIKRLFDLRQGLAMLDWKDKSSHDMRELLLRTVSSPLYLKSNEGKNLIITLFTIDESLVGDLHKAIRAQVHDAKRSILQVYGDIYFGAWMKSDKIPQIRKAIEEIVIQDLMYAILHVANPAMVKNLQTILEKFHEQKKTPVVESLLHRMYAPILWRSLTAANPRVRVNGALVLTETFPLLGGTSSADKAVDRGIRALKSLLVDTDPRVRVAAGEATAQILLTYWEVVPPTEIRTLLTHIVAEHASDKSSSAVRAGSLTAISTLLGTEQSHGVLRPLLPMLGNLIHDKVERVRFATVRMLHAIKSTRGIKYYHVVPVDHLLARLNDEGLPPKSPVNPVASALTQLMMNSYFPQGEGVSGAEQVKRSLSFLSSDPNAAMVFYANLASHVSVGSVAKLAALLLRCLVAAVETDLDCTNHNMIQGKKRGRYYSTRDDETGTGNDGPLSAADTALMASLADAICCLWESIETQLQEPNNETCRAFLVAAFSGAVVGNVNSHFEQKATTLNASNQRELVALSDCHRICASILRCAGRLTPKIADGLAAQITLKLSSIGKGQTTNLENVTPHIALLCMWGLTDDVAKSLASSIVQGFVNEEELASPAFEGFSNGSKKRKAGRGRNLSDPVVPLLSPNMALSVLDEILRGPDPSSVAARKAILSSHASCVTLERALELGTVYAQSLFTFDPIFGQHINDARVEFVLRACEAYGRFALHKEATQKQRLGFSEHAKTLLDWTTLWIAPVLLEAKWGSGTPLKDLNISRISRTSVSPMPSTPPSIMPPPRQRTDRKETPEKFKTSDEPSLKMQIEDSFPSDTMDLARGAAKSLMQSSCVIFSEWLAVGGSGANDISLAATRWCDIFSVDTKRELQSELLPSFLRLAVQLCKSNGDFSVLRQLLQQCDESTETDEVMLIKKSIMTLVCGRDAKGNLMLTRTVKTILQAADWLLEMYATNEVVNIKPGDITEAWVIRQGCIATCLTSVMANKQGVIHLAKELVSRLMTKGSETKLSSRTIFEAQCLWLMCGNDNGNGAVDVRKLIRNIDIENFTEGCELKTVLVNMLESPS